MIQLRRTPVYQGEMETSRGDHPIGAVYQRSPGDHPSRPRNSSPSPHKTSWATAPLAATLAIFTAGCAETATTTETPSTQTSEAADPLCSESAFLDFPIDRLARGTLVPEALAICDQCPVLEPCQEDAIEQTARALGDVKPALVQGGLSPKELQELAKARGLPEQRRYGTRPDIYGPQRRTGKRAS